MTTEANGGSIVSTENASLDQEKYAKPDTKVPQSVTESGPGVPFVDLKPIKVRTGSEQSQVVIRINIGRYVSQQKTRLFNEKYGARD